MSIATIFNFERYLLKAQFEIMTNAKVLPPGVAHEPAAVASTERG